MLSARVKELIELDDRLQQIIRQMITEEQDAEGEIDVARIRRIDRFEQLQRDRRPTGAMTQAEAIADLDSAKWVPGVQEDLFYIKTRDDQ